MDDTRVFYADAPPANMDAEQAEWIIRQLNRVSVGSSTVVLSQNDGIGKTDGLVEDTALLRNDLDTHIQNQADPHITLLPWKVDATHDDLYPDSTASEIGIGTIEKPVAFVLIGTQEAPGTSGVEGAVIDRADTDDGGLLLLGIRGIDPNSPPVPPIVGNSPIELNGNNIFLAGQTGLLIENPITEDHEIILGPSVQIPDGRYFSPLLLGPEKVYSQQETAQDATDYDVLDVGEVSVLNPPLTLANAYAADVTTLIFQVYLDNPGRSTSFDVIFKIDGVENARANRIIEYGSTLFAVSVSLDTALNIGQVLSLYVEAIGTHVQSEGWVLGTNQPTKITIKQG